MRKKLFILLFFVVGFFVLDVVWYRVLGSYLHDPKFIRAVFELIINIPKKYVCEFQGKHFQAYHGAFSSSYVCVNKVTDGGKSCQSGSSCQSGYCFITKGAVPDASGTYIGRCAHTGERNYCRFAEIENGYIAVDMRNMVCD